MAGLGILEANVKHRAGRLWYRTGIELVVYISYAGLKVGGVVQGSV